MITRQSLTRTLRIWKFRALPEGFVPPWRGCRKIDCEVRKVTIGLQISFVNLLRRAAKHLKVDREGCDVRLTAHGVVWGYLTPIDGFVARLRNHSDQELYFSFGILLLLSHIPFCVWVRFECEFLQPQPGHRSRREREMSQPRLLIEMASTFNPIS